MAYLGGILLIQCFIYSKDILSLVVTSGLSYRDIAKMTGTTEANIKVKVHRARARLRLLLEAPATKPGEE